MKALKSYVGAYRFLSRVIKDYATVLLPLEKMIPGKYASKSGGNVKVTWTPELITCRNTPNPLMNKLTLFQFKGRSLYLNIYNLIIMRSPPMYHTVVVVIQSPVGSVHPA